MIGLLQRITKAHVEIKGEIVAAVGAGLLVLVGVQRGDTELHADRLLERLLNFRVFPDEQGKMNRDLRDMGGSMLLVPQFTLAADTRNGTRPSFKPAAPLEESRSLFNYLLEQARAAHDAVDAGQFATNMLVSLTNDGPATFWIEIPNDSAG
ncbi:MAG TPA: D-tyrosyl-tRNA(Tyr) deacylase [Gammaproteobacteria bacterium]|nr:D-tyrosyl-tRNA(Tyr) deacylase [Gammaproteobacteria bacterium]|tara:strand:+ start:272 stop:727 length:456 start_codon:yes stop_codon:yes gene_type:complete